MMIALFWLCLGLTIYTYLGYPLFISLWARLRPKPIRQGEICPTVSMIIAAYNEEEVIASKIENALALSYPKGRLEIIVVTDGSTDRTTEIAQSFEPAGVQVLHKPERQGKTAALNRAVPYASGEILFFSDANTFYAHDVIPKLVRNFHEASVGGVCGRKAILQDGERSTTQGETAFWWYEARLKQAESQVNSIVTADGEVFAMRRALFNTIPDHIVHDDMYLTLKMIEQGYRVVYEHEASSAEYPSKTSEDEFHLKVRYSSGGYQIFSIFKQMFVPPMTFFAFEFISHKLFRWLAPFFLIGILFSSASIPEIFYQGIFWLQISFYTMGFLGWAFQKICKSKVFYFPHYFCMGNTAALYGFFRYFIFGQSTLWRKASR
jgi:cellulose synthase/poly-beta-1,6-N-acetylglucosamine synthase-like glycosyltransferase